MLTQTSKQERRKRLKAEKEKYELEENMTWNGRCLTIEPRKRYKKNDKNKISAFQSRTNFTLVAGNPNNGKEEYIKKMLAERKFEAVREAIKEDDRRRAEHAYFKWLAKYGKKPWEVPDTVERTYLKSIYEALVNDDDQNRMDLIELINTKDSTFGYKCKPIFFTLKDGEDRTSAIEGFIDQIKEVMAPPKLEVEWEVEDLGAKAKSDDPTEFKTKIIIKEFIQFPPNILAVGDFSAEERKYILDKIHTFQVKQFIRCYCTCLVYDVKSADKDTGIEYKHPLAQEGWNDVYYLQKNGKVRKVCHYHDRLI